MTTAEMVETVPTSRSESVDRAPSTATASIEPQEAAAQEPLSRDSRQRSLVPPNRLALFHAIIIGVGAIGRQVALQLAAMGVPRMTLIDNDTVGVENMAPQGYWPENLDTAKVFATANVCLSINPELEVVPIGVEFEPDMVPGIEGGSPVVLPEGVLEPVLFCCVDSIKTRQEIWEATKITARFFTDGRMSGEVLRVLSVDNPVADSYYETTLFSAGEAFAGACTAKATIYSASIAAGLMVGQYAKWLRQFPTERDISLNLLTMEMGVE